MLLLLLWLCSLLLLLVLLHELLVVERLCLWRESRHVARLQMTEPTAQITTATARCRGSGGGRRRAIRRGNHTSIGRRLTVQMRGLRVIGLRLHGRWLLLRALLLERHARLLHRRAHLWLSTDLLRGIARRHGRIACRRCAVAWRHDTLRMHLWLWLLLRKRRIV